MKRELHKVSEELNAYLEAVGKGKLHISQTDLIYIIRCIEQNTRLESEFDLELEEHQDMREIHECNAHEIIRELKRAKYND